MNFRRTIYFAVFVFLSVIVSSCSFLDKYDPGFCERHNNLQNFTKVEIGMTKKEVLQVMGLPLIDEKYNQPNVWFYYTDWDWADCARTEIESTPIVFKDGLVVGKGTVFYRSYSRQDWQYSESRAMSYDTTGKEE